jgi:ribosomal protein L31E
MLCVKLFLTKKNKVKGVELDTELVEKICGRIIELANYFI